MGDEEWVIAAAEDDAVVAELLLGLKEVKHHQRPPPLSRSTASKPALSLEWTVRQRRSRAVVVPAKNQAPRASPTTPLSWSGGTSVSGGGGGGSVDGGAEEESGRLSPSKQPDTSRSKVIGTSDATNSKKSRKKKTLAELKEEEDLLVKEGRQLKRELETLRHNLENERARHESFKRKKVDMHELQAVEIHRTITPELEVSNQLQQPKTASRDPVAAQSPPTLASSGESLLSPPAASTCTEENKEAGSDKFVLPDLNIPFEENCDAQCGVS